MWNTYSHCNLEITNGPNWHYVNILASCFVQSVQCIHGPFLTLFGSERSQYIFVFSRVYRMNKEDVRYQCDPNHTRT